MVTKSRHVCGRPCPLQQWLWSVQQVISVTCLSFLMVSANDFETSCSIPSVEPLYNTQLTCNFPEDLNVTKKDFTIYHYNDKKNPEAVVDCWWLGGTIDCFSKHGFSFDRIVSRHLKATATRVSYKHIGTYACQVAGYGPSSLGTCEFKLQLGEYNTCDIVPAGSEGEGNLTCYFNEVVSETQRNFTVYRHTEDDKQNAVLDCWWSGQEPKCWAESGYLLLSKVSSYVVLRLPKETRNNTYSCGHAHSLPQEKKTCQMIKGVFVDKEERGKTEETSQNVGIIVGIIVSIGLVVVGIVFLVIFLKRRRSATKRGRRDEEEHQELLNKENQSNQQLDEKTRELITQQFSDLLVKGVEDMFPDITEGCFVVPPVYFNTTRYTTTMVADQVANIPESPEASVVTHDKAVQRVLFCLRHLAEHRRENMFLVTQFKYEDYLNGDQAFCGHTLEKPTDVGETNEAVKCFDFMIIHRQHGIVVGVVVDVFDNDDHIQGGEEGDKTILSHLSDAIQQLKKAEHVVSHVMADISQFLPIRKTLIFPNLSSSSLQRALETNVKLAEELRGILNFKIVENSASVVCTDSLQRISADRLQDSSIIVTADHTPKHSKYEFKRNSGNSIDKTSTNANILPSEDSTTNNKMEKACETSEGSSPKIAQCPVTETANTSTTENADERAELTEDHVNNQKNDSTTNLTDDHANKQSDDPAATVTDDHIPKHSKDSLKRESGNSIDKTLRNANTSPSEDSTTNYKMETASEGLSSRTVQCPATETANISATDTTDEHAKLLADQVDHQRKATTTQSSEGYGADNLQVDPTETPMNVLTEMYNASSAKRSQNSIVEKSENSIAETSNDPMAKTSDNPTRDNPTVTIPEDPMRLCLCADHLSDPQTPTDVTPTVTEDLEQWWSLLMSSSFDDTGMNDYLYLRVISRFCGPATTPMLLMPGDSEPVLLPRTLEQAVSLTGELFERLTLYSDMRDLLKEARLFLCGPPGTGKTMMLMLAGRSWLLEGHDVYILKTSESSTDSRMKQSLKMENSPRLSGDGVRGNVFVYCANMKDEKSRKTALKEILKHSGDKPAHIIADELECDTEEVKQFIETILKTNNNHNSMWITRSRGSKLPAGFRKEILTTALRCPPAVVREASTILTQHFPDLRPYSPSHFPSPTDGPPVKHIYHEGQGHARGQPRDCEQCAHEVVNFLTRIIRNSESDSEEGTSDGTQKASQGIERQFSLHARDVMILFESEVDHMNTTMLKKLKQAGIFVDDRTALSAGENDVALAPEASFLFGEKGKVAVKKVIKPGIFFEVTVTPDISTGKSDVALAGEASLLRDEKRKVVVYVEDKVDNSDIWWTRLHGITSCYSQLIRVTNVKSVHNA